MKEGSIVSAILWMCLLSLLLFWLPTLGPLIAGFVGGQKAGGVGRAILAVILPAALFGVLLLFLGSALTGLPLIGAVAAVGGFALALSHVGGLLLGAIIGGIAVHFK
ncbi:MAG: hypothetical protein P9M14_15820 [Candidatus Alcyoniella australis]|nr:hypothetical protein [Candidatus Alcyoniella australis]